MEKARRGLLIYFAVLIPVSGVIETTVLRLGGNIGRYSWLIFLLMWTPAIASFVARAVLKEGIRDVSFRLSSKALWTLVAAVVFPLVVGSIAYGAGWATGLVGYQTPSHGFLLNLARATALGCTIGVVSGAGEEIGWRGYMLTRLVDAGVPQPLLASGIIWALWHFPLILSGQYASGPHPGISAGIFLVDVVGIAYMIGALRLRSGSVWPAALLHGAWNGIIQVGFDPASTGPGATTWVGESGIFVAAVSLVIGVVAARVLWPSDSRSATTSAGTPLRGASTQR